MKDFVFSVGLWAFLFGFIVVVSNTEAQGIEKKNEQPSISELKVVDAQISFGH
jgi:hypothetical protein